MQKSNPISVYIERRFPKSQRPLVESFFQHSNRFPCAAWKPFGNSRGHGYKKGKQVCLTLDYNSDSLEVKAYLEEDGQNVIVSIGNSGFPFEPLMAKARYEEIANKLTSYVQA